MKRVRKGIESVTMWMVIGMWWVMLALGALIVGSFVLGMVFSSSGGGAPDWAHQMISFGMVGLAVVGFLTLGLYGVGCGLDAQLRRWAAQQAIDLDPLTVKKRRRRRTGTKDG